MVNIKDYLQETAYPGRGIIVGKEAEGKHAVVAYFISGRSVNSRNRIFTENEYGGIRTQAFDPEKLSDPTLVIYNCVRTFGNKTVVTNGEQTDTIAELMDKQYSFEQALRAWTYEPDSLCTPRISAILRIAENECNHAMSIIKTAECGGGSPCCPDAVYRFNFAYNNPCNGIGHLLHTYDGDLDNPKPFKGEPKAFEISGGIDDFGDLLWNSLNPEMKISLFVRYIEIATGKTDDRIYNINQ
jgi:hypothetical protein